ncbi:MAG: hypothetical protein ACE5DO_07560, partial [Desulfobacterales bacterium]
MKIEEKSGTVTLDNTIIRLEYDLGEGVFSVFDGGQLWIENAIRDAVGPETFLNGVNVDPASLVGIVDGWRPGLDYLFGICYEGNLKQLACRWYLHNRFWLNDPEAMDIQVNPWCLDPNKRLNWADPGYLKVDLPLEEARAWASLLGMYGVALHLAGYIEDLPEERKEILRRILPIHLTPNMRAPRPLDLFEREWPRIWDLRVEKPFGTWHILGTFNFLEHDETHNVSFEDMGLDPGKDYLVYNFGSSA